MKNEHVINNHIKHEYVRSINEVFYSDYLKECDVSQNWTVCIAVTLYSSRYRNANTALPQDIVPHASMSSSSGNHLRATKCGVI